MSKIHLIYALSFSWSCGTLLIFSYLPYYATEVLGITHTKLGLIEGVAICSAFMSKIVAGLFCDYFKNRATLIKVGTYLTFLSRILFFTANSVMALFIARTTDRISKGIRSTPTDALTADLAIEHNSYHYLAHRQSFYTLGGLLGALLTMIFSPTQNTITTKLPFLLACILGAISIFLVHGLKDDTIKQQVWPKWTLQECKLIPKNYWIFLFFVFILMLARFSEAFLLLRSHKVQLSARFYPSIIICMDLAHSIFAYYFKYIISRFSFFKTLIASLVIVAGSHLGLYFTQTLASFFFFTLLIGIHMGLSQPILKIYVAKLAPAHLKGTSFALFNFVSGIGVLLGNFFIGLISDTWGIEYSFVGGLFCVIIASLYLLKNKLALEHFN